MRIRVAQVKAYPTKGDLTANREQLMTILAGLADHVPDVVVTPEAFLDGYIATEAFVTRENIGQYAIDPMTSSHVAEISGWASRHNTWFILGCARVTPDGVCNSALVLNRAGHMVGTYDKIHCLSDDRKYLPGRDLPVFSSDFGPFGVIICADRRWPETVRTLALKGARVIFNPTYGFHDDKNVCMMRTRAYESEIFIVFTHPAQSLVTGPESQVVLNETSVEVSFAVSEIDLLEVDTARERSNSHLRNRRPDVYRL
jgi:predicted amidohydrolase